MNTLLAVIEAGERIHGGISFPTFMFWSGMVLGGLMGYIWGFRSGIYTLKRFADSCRERDKDL